MCCLLLHPRPAGLKEKYRFTDLHMAQGTKHAALLPPVGRGVMAVGAAELLCFDFEVAVAHRVSVLSARRMSVTTSPAMQPRRMGVSITRPEPWRGRRGLRSRHWRRWRHSLGAQVLRMQ